MTSDSRASTSCDVKLLPLPDKDDDLPRSGMWNGHGREGSDPCWLRESVEAYARACIEADRKMRLVEGRPSEPGIYAVQGFHYGHPEDHAIVEVIERDGELLMNLHEANSDRHRWGRLSECSDKFRWYHIAGPFTTAQQEERE